MWRIYTNLETLDTLHKRHNVYTFCGPDKEVYVHDLMFTSLIIHLVADGFCTDFGAEYVSDSEYSAMCDSYDSNSILTDF